MPTQATKARINSAWVEHDDRQEPMPTTLGPRPRPENKGWWEWRDGTWHWFAASWPGTLSYCQDTVATGYTKTPGQSQEDTCDRCLEGFHEANPTAKPCPSGMHAGLMACGCT